RQARQNAYEGAIDQMVEESADSDDPIVAMRIIDANDSRVRITHHLWNDKVLAVDDPLWKVVKPPSDFMCRCHREPVRRSHLKEWPITPDTQRPTALPGQSYRYYAPRQRQE
ncbi:MAG: hypothetical protein GY841_13130, partial [FCB group bacterium]|nr:hypothetical protein [FCB group bacterium]